MADIYNANPTFGGAFSMDEATLTFSVGDGDDGGLGYLIQSVNVSYNRPIQRIFELGPSKTTYYVAGRAEGRMGISRLAAPAPVNETFLTRFADVCQVESNTLQIDANPNISCDGALDGATGQNSVYTFNYCLIESIQFQMAVQSLALTENMSLVFASMETN